MLMEFAAASTSNSRVYYNVKATGHVARLRQDIGL